MTLLTATSIPVSHPTDFGYSQVRKGAKWPRCVGLRLRHRSNLSAPCIIMIFDHPILCLVLMATTVPIFLGLRFLFKIRTSRSLIFASSLPGTVISVLHIMVIYKSSFYIPLFRDGVWIGLLVFPQIWIFPMSALLSTTYMFRSRDTPENPATLLFSSAFTAFLLFIYVLAYEEYLTPF